MNGVRQVRLVHPVLRFRPVQYVGKISYGIYLWHYVVFAMVEQFHPLGAGWHSLILKTVIAFGAASASFHLLEKPCLRLKDRFARPSVSDANPVIYSGLQSLGSRATTRP